MGPVWFDPLLFATTCLGGGGLLLSLYLGYASTRRTAGALAVQVLVGLAALFSGSFALVAWEYGQPLAVWGSAATVLSLYMLIVVIPSAVAGRYAAATLSLARRRRGRLATILALSGFCPFFGIGLVFCQIDETLSLQDDELARLGAGETPGALPKRDFGTPLTTDCGRPIPTLYDLPGFQPSLTPELLAAQQRYLDQYGLHDEVIHLPQAWQFCNCHGFTFTGGRFSIGGADVPAILDDNGYLPVEHVQVGDVAVYRDADGLVMHSGIVCGAAPDGLILVESKWGRFGRFVHPHDRHIYAHTICTFYRSPRSGHLLRGSDPNQPAGILSASMHTPEAECCDAVDCDSDPE